MANRPFQWFTHLQTEPATSCKYLESLYTVKIHPLSYSMRISIAFALYSVVDVSQLCVGSVIYSCYGIIEGIGISKVWGIHRTTLTWREKDACEWGSGTEMGGREEV